jgi:O-antigen/teichoic acid export membrane protein
MTPEPSRAATFTGRVAVLFGTQLFGTGITIINGILLARLLGPAARGDYALLILVPSTAVALTLIGMPQAFGFFSARGHTRGIVAKSLGMTLFLSTVAFVAALVLLPFLLGTVLKGIGIEQVLFAFLAVPLALSTIFNTGIVMGRQAVRWKAAVSIAMPLATLVLLIVILGGFGASVNGAVAVYLLAALVGAVGFLLGARRVSAANAPGEPVSYRQLLGYGLPMYPASLAVFLNYRVDVYLIAWLIADPSAPLGYYAMAVALAELVFFFPDAVSILFFPHVAGSLRDEADRQVAMVSRVTLLIAGLVALALVPAAFVIFSVFLPAFGPSMEPLLVLLPGVVALSAAKVVGGYMIGIARPGTVSYVSVATFGVNIVANLLLTPRFGIVGAAAASLVSYTFSSVLIISIAARITRTPMASFWIPRVSDVRYVVATTVALVRRVVDGFTTRPGHLGA